MRTTLDLPETLLEKVKKILKTETKTETIIEALERIIDWNERQQLISYRGKIDLDIDLDKLRNRH